MSTRGSNDYLLLLEWEETLVFLFDLTEKFPKRLRHSLSWRIENTAMEILEDFIEAGEPGQSSVSLHKAYVKLEFLRVLLRLAYSRRCISLRAYEVALQKMCLSKVAVEERSIRREA
jgi:hypothetical protein